MSEAPTDAASLVAWLEAEGLTSPALAQLLDCSLYAVHEWRKGRRALRPLVQRALRDVGRNRHLTEPWAGMTREGGGAVFEAWRIDRGLTYTDIARALPLAKNEVRKWETGERLISVLEARALRDIARELRRREPRPRA